MPPLTIENSSALVAGGGAPSKENDMKAQQNTAPAVQRVKVLRAFQSHERKVLEKGTEATLPLAFAREMRAANKVAFIEDEPAPAMPAEERPEGETRKKGERNAR